MKGGCGAGCQLHQLAYCFYVAFATGRTMIPEPAFFLSKMVSKSI